MRRSWVPSKDHTNTGRLCSAGSGRQPVPRRRSSYAALRLPHSRRPRLRSSLAFGLPRRGRFFYATIGGRQRVRPADTLRVGDASSALRGPVSSRGEVRVSQVSGPSSSCVPQSKTPPGAVPCSPMTQGPPSPLRIAAPVTGHVARLTTGLGGLTPDRTGFAPAGRRTGFHDFIASSILSDQHAWPH